MRGLTRRGEFMRPVLVSQSSGSVQIQFNESDGLIQDQAAKRPGKIAGSAKLLHLRMENHRGCILGVCHRIGGGSGKSAIAVDRE